MEERKHYRIALNELRENPDKGIYLTQNELKKYGIFAGLILFLFSTESIKKGLCHMAEAFFIS